MGCCMCFLCEDRLQILCVLYFGGLLFSGFALICSLSNQMRQLDFSKWLSLFKEIFSNFLILLSRCKVQHIFHTFE